MCWAAHRQRHRWPPGTAPPGIRCISASPCCFPCHSLHPPRVCKHLPCPTLTLRPSLPPLVSCPLQPQGALRDHGPRNLVHLGRQGGHPGGRCAGRRAVQRPVGLERHRHRPQGCTEGIAHLQHASQPVFTAPPLHWYQQLSAPPLLARQRFSANLYRSAHVSTNSTLCCLARRRGHRRHHLRRRQVPEGEEGGAAGAEQHENKGQHSGLCGAGSTQGLSGALWWGQASGLCGADMARGCVVRAGLSTVLLVSGKQGWQTG